MEQPFFLSFFPPPPPPFAASVQQLPQRKFVKGEGVTDIIPKRFFFLFSLFTLSSPSASSRTQGAEQG